ncbi:hypothetical protein Tco_0828566 [Tanacetum coccineum]
MVDSQETIEISLDLKRTWNIKTKQKSIGPQLPATDDDDDLKVGEVEDPYSEGVRQNTTERRLESGNEHVHSKTSSVFVNMIIEEALVKIEKVKYSDGKTEPYWSNLYGNGNNQPNPGDHYEVDEIGPVLHTLWPWLNVF